MNGRSPALVLLRRVLPALVFLLCFTAVARACPACEVGIGDETVRTTLSGYIWSFCFLAICPFVVVGSVIGAFYSMLRDEPVTSIS